MVVTPAATAAETSSSTVPSPWFVKQVCVCVVTSSMDDAPRYQFQARLFAVASMNASMSASVV